MNILLFTDADVFAGTERHMLDLARALRDLGENVRIACPRPGILADRATDAGIPVLPIPKIGQVDKNAIHILANLIKNHEVDIIHAHNGRTHIAAAFAVRKARRTLGKKPHATCIATQHFLAPTRTTRRGLKAFIANYLHHKASRFTAHTIAISDAVRDAALRREDCRPDAITTIHNGINPPDLYHAQDPITLRQSLNLDAATPMIFCAARLQPEKDIPTLIAAMHLLQKSHPAARCFIAGEGDLQPTLQRQIDDLNLNPTVKLLGFRNDIPALLRACDLFVLPSLAEPFGLVIAEAMALSKPVIATRTGGPVEIIDHNRTGLLVSPSDPTALAAALAQLLTDPAQRLQMGQAGHARFLSHFTATRMATQIRDLYRQTANKPGAMPCGP